MAAASRAMAASDNVSCSPLPVGGYDVEFIDSPPDSWECPVCLSTLRDPHLLSCCGVKICQSCLSGIVSTKRPCPKCRMDDFSTLLEKELQRSILSLKVKCSLGCSWDGELRHLDKHVSPLDEGECPLVTVTCKHGCGQVMKRKDVTEHEENVCPKQPIEVKLARLQASVDRQMMEMKNNYEADIHDLNLKLTKQEKEMEEMKKELEKVKDHNDYLTTIIPVPTLALPDGRSFTIKIGDIIEETADVIVNAADKHLKHSGGLAGALDIASEGALQRHCDIITARHGDIHTGDAVTTAAGGKLKCRWVVHAVGPMASECDDNNTRYSLIHSAVTNALKQAQSVNALSIVLPALSTGLYAVDPSISAQAIFAAIVSFNYNEECLKDIRIVIVDQPTYGCFIEQLQLLKASSILTEAHRLNHLSDQERGTVINYSGPSTSGNITYSSIYSSMPSGSTIRPSTSSNITYSSLFSGSTVRPSTSGNITYPSLPSDLTSSVPVIHSTTTTTPLSPSTNSDDLLESATTFTPTKTIRSSECPICLSKVTNPKKIRCCKTVFCTACIENALEYSSLCPMCQLPLLPLKGNQPNGTMKHEITSIPLPGFPKCGTIKITYHLPDGIQGPNHPSPGQRYYGITRVAYLPDNKEGRHVVKLLQKAFNAGLVFTIVKSPAATVMGKNDTVTWNDIHHKTNTNGGSSGNGYPDPTYLKRVKYELKTKGIY